MKLCLICKNNTHTSIHNSICNGCITLFKHPLHTCTQCGVELQNPNALCGSCLKSPPAFSGCCYVCDYLPPIDKWVMSLKFSGNILMTRLMAELLVDCLKNIESDYVLIPVPLHTSRLRKRGFNQAYEIVKELAKLTDCNFDTSLLRVKNTKMQAQLKFAERIKNVKNAFAVKQPFSLKKVILVDDVMTTGNTLNECAKQLKKAGADDIRVVVFARKS